MPPLRPPLALILTLALSSLPALAAPEGGGATARVNAWQLIAAARSSLADLGRRMDDRQSGFDPRRPDHVELRSSLVRLHAQLGTVEARFRAHDPQVFAALEAGSRGLGELRIRWSQAGVANPGFAASLRSLSAAYRRLRSAYGREGLRFRQGPPLTEGERRHFERLQQGTLIFVSRLRSLRQQALHRGDGARVGEIDRFLSAADRIAAAEPDLASYLNTTMANDEMAGEWTAEAEDLRRLDAGGWGDADEAVAQLYVESDIGHVFQLDLGTSQDWDYLDQPTEIDLGDAGDAGDAGDGPPRVQVFHLAGKGPDGMSRFEAGPAASGELAEGPAEEGGALREEALQPSASGAGDETRQGDDAPTPAAAALDPRQAWEIFRALLRLWVGPP